MEQSSRNLLAISASTFIVCNFEFSLLWNSLALKKYPTTHHKLGHNFLFFIFKRYSLHISCMKNKMAEMEKNDNSKANFLNNKAKTFLSTKMIKACVDLWDVQFNSNSCRWQYASFLSQIRMTMKWMILNVWYKSWTQHLYHHHHIVTKV